MNQPNFFPPDNDFRRFHLVGIGGIGMSAIAEILLGAGYSVSGSDLQDTPLLRRLAELGVQVNLKHSARHLGQAQLVVYSSAIPASNPELRAAKARGLPLLHRSEMLAELMRYRTGISVTGTHGKTTTCSMIASMTVEAGLEPTVMVGAQLASWGSNARLGTGRLLVAEADESDRSFLRLPTICGVVTNIDADHLDVYRDLPDLQEAFLQFLRQLPFYGVAVVCLEDAGLRPILKKVQRRMLTYGFTGEADFSARNLELATFTAAYDCYHEQQLLGRVRLRVAGKHNVLNSLAAVAVGHWLKLPFGSIGKGLENYQGAERRLELKGQNSKGVWVIDDYAHHPTEIQAVLETYRASGRRLLVVYQPHRYSRTQHLMEMMDDCFRAANRLYLVDIYPAGEAPVSGVSSAVLADRLKPVIPVRYFPDRNQLVRTLASETKAGDLVLTLGAGDVGLIGQELLDHEKS